MSWFYVVVPFLFVDLSNFNVDMHVLGCCGKWVNESIDFAISKNKWPVRFDNAAENVDLVPEFICTMWLGYVAKMRGHPSPNAKSSQLILKYLLTNDSLVVKAWRARIYRYSSGTLFAQISQDLQEYLVELQDPSVLRRVGGVRVHGLIPCTSFSRHNLCALTLLYCLCLPTCLFFMSTCNVIYVCRLVLFSCRLVPFSCIR